MHWVTCMAYNEFLNTVCFRQFAMLLVFVPQFQTISSDWFANIKADFILPFHFYASTEFLLSCLIVKPLQHAIVESNRDQQRCWITHCRLVYTGATYDLPHSNRIKVKNTTVKTDQTSTYVTLDIECDAFYLFLITVLWKWSTFRPVYNYSCCHNGLCFISGC